MKYYKKCKACDTMVACIIALVVLGTMSIFSAKYRSWFKEALGCVTRRFVLKPCNTGFDQKVKSIVTAKLIKRSKRLTRFTYKHFEAISWIFMIIFVISLILTAQGMYSVALYGTCNSHSDDFCIFDPAGESSCGSAHCAENGCGCGPKSIDSNCRPGNNYAACDGNCTCNTTVCG